MKNLLQEPRFTRSQQRQMMFVGAVPVLTIHVIINVLTLIINFLKKHNKGVNRVIWFTLTITGLLLAFTTDFSKPAYAPKVDASVPVYGTTTEHDQIANYIVEVFGKDSPKAFRLLQECGENASLNPNAVNTEGNYPVGSRDIGVFQVNEYWQKTQAKFLFNWKINVEIAHQLYVENGNSFKLWTGGRKCGI